MQGIVLAAGWGSRLRPHTDHLPKALVPLGDGLSPLHQTLANFAEVGIASAAVVVGYKAEVIEDHRAGLERRYGVRLELVPNEKALVWNNAYSLLVGLRAAGGEDVIVVNGDTVHPSSFEKNLLVADRTAVTLAVDSRPGLGEEEMKVQVGDGRVTRITKVMDPAAAFGEYVGVSLLPGTTHDALVRSLNRVVNRDPSLYYEDGYQDYLDRGHPVLVCDTLGEPWTEIDDEIDLRRAKEIVCRY